MAGVPHWRDIPGRSNEVSPAVAENQRRQFEIMDEVAPISGEPVFRKAAPSAFFGTPLAGYLNQLRVDTVVVAGESTSGCIRATAVDASSYRFDVIVVEDCVFDRHEAAHAMNLFDIDQKYGDVLGLDETMTFFDSVHTPSHEPSELRGSVGA
jgi:nicotinamidase-related amidase